MRLGRRKTCIEREAAHRLARLGGSSSDGVSEKAHKHKACGPLERANRKFPHDYPHNSLTPRPRRMPKKLSRRGGVAILGTAEDTVQIYTVQRSNGYPQFSVAWHEVGKRKIKAFADKDAAYLFAQQTVVQLQNGAAIEGPATLRRSRFSSTASGSRNRWIRTLWWRLRNG